MPKLSGSNIFASAKGFAPAQLLSDPSRRKTLQSPFLFTVRAGCRSNFREGEGHDASPPYRGVQSELILKGSTFFSLLIFYFILFYFFPSIFLLLVPYFWLPRLNVVRAVQ